MKRNVLNIITIAAVLFSFVMTSCKKGENDPGLSLISRKGRLVGEWTLKSSVMTAVDDHERSDDKNHSTTTVNTFDGTSMTYATTTPKFKTISTSPYYEFRKDTTITSKPTTYSKKTTIAKDGTYTEVNTEVETITESNYNDSGTYVSTSTNTVKGVWFFIEGNKALETGDKEGFVMQMTELVSKKETVFTPVSATWGTAYTSTNTNTRTYTGKNSGMSDASVQYIAQLKSKELIIVTDGKYTYTNVSSYASGSSTSTNTSTGSYSETGTQTLTQE